MAKTIKNTPRVPSIEVSHGTNEVRPCTKAEPWGIDCLLPRFGNEHKMFISLTLRR